MDTLGRTLLLRFLRTASAVFVALSLVVLAATSLWVARSVPSVDPVTAFRFGLDALLVGCEAWGTVLACAAIGIVAQRAAAEQHLLIVAMTGRPTWRPFIPCWVAVACACVGQAWWSAEVVPEANYRLRWPVKEALPMAAEALRLNGIASLGSLEVRAKAESDGSWSDFMLASRDGRTAIAVSADKASIGLHATETADEIGAVRLAVSDGRLVARDPERAFVNVAFDAMEMELDSDFGGRPSRSALLPLSYYRSSELPAYGQQMLISLRAGTKLQHAQVLRADSIEAIQALRTMASLHPLFAVVLMTLAVARPRARSAWIAAGALLIVGIGLSIQIALETAACRLGVVQSAWVAVIPPLLCIALSHPLWRGGIGRA